MKTNLYNNDGTLSPQAQSLLSPKPDDMSRAEWRKIIKEFKSQLSEEDFKEFLKLKKGFWASVYYQKAKKEGKTYYQKQDEETRLASYKAYYQKNKQEILIQQKCSRQKQDEEKRLKRLAYHKTYYREKKQQLSVYNRAYRQKLNKEERKVYMAEYARNRREKDPLYNFFCSIRSQALRVVKQVGLGKKPANTFKWVGCSPEELKAHIESLFLEGMTWDNYGRYGWHVDHIRPVSSFKPEEWEQINHYTNLQPLWWQDNLSKSNKLQD